MMKIILLAVLLVFEAGFASAATQDDEVAACKAWLRMVDDGDYAAAWADVAQLFKDQFDQQAWVKQVSGPREQVGAMKSRTVNDVVESTTMPNAPKGHYATVTFDTVFANKKDSGEMIVVVLEDGRWKVGGYYIK